MQTCTRARVQAVAAAALMHRRVCLRLLRCASLCRMRLLLPLLRLLLAIPRLIQPPSLAQALALAQALVTCQLAASGCPPQPWTLHSRSMRIVMPQLLIRQRPHQPLALPLSVQIHQRLRRSLSVSLRLRPRLLTVRLGREQPLQTLLARPLLPHLQTSTGD